MPVDRVERQRDEAAGVRFMVSADDGDPRRETIVTPDAWFVTASDGDVDLVDIAQAPALSVTGLQR
jgi:hypothetical protein